ncbi:MAG: hypothetical protein M1825_004394 [Sarcosagium campestre]|nr:MAG: hypothetical protein M1825_004394 [Sarcosagium campestre]
MAPFNIIYCGRSDGKLQISIPGQDAPDLNQPTPEQLDDTPNENNEVNYFKLLSDTDGKSLDWRRKLAGMFMRQLGVPAEADAKNYILAALPDGYRLYEHGKYVKDPQTGELSGVMKSQGKAGADRADAYLYGHPEGRKKRYRSPNDFFPHLLWLATDVQGDRGNCSCKLCTREEYEPADAQPRKRQRRAKTVSAGAGQGPGAGPLAVKKTKTGADAYDSSGTARRDGQGAAGMMTGASASPGSDFNSVISPVSATQPGSHASRATFEQGTRQDTQQYAAAAPAAAIASASASAIAATNTASPGETSRHNPVLPTADHDMMSPDTFSAQYSMSGVSPMGGDGDDQMQGLSPSDQGSSGLHGFSQGMAMMGQPMSAMLQDTDGPGDWDSGINDGGAEDFSNFE